VTIGEYGTTIDSSLLLILENSGQLPSYLITNMSAVPAALVQYLQSEKVMDFINISTKFAFLYDYLLTLRFEIKLIWFSPWNYTKILFLVVRYMPFITIYIGLQIQFSDTSIEKCKVFVPLGSWLMILQMVLAEGILAVRTWAVWNRNKLVGILLAVSILTGFIPLCILLNKFLQSMEYGHAPYPGFRGCFITRSNRMLWGVYATTTATQSIFLVLVAISAFKSYRLGHVGRFSLIVYRDGIMFYVYLLCISAANVAAIIVLPPSLALLLTPFEYLLYSVLTIRIILNIREVASEGMQTEMHSIYHEQPSVDIPLHFFPRGTLSDSEQSLQETSFVVLPNN